jgi:ectoine hydroxylase
MELFMNLSALANEFWRQGYLSIDNFFGEELMDAYQSHVLQHFGKNSAFVHSAEFLEKSNTDVIPWFPQLEGVHAFDVAEQDQRLIKLTDEILGAGWSSLYSMVMYSHQGSKGQAWHQDCPPEDKSQFNLNRLVYTMDIDQRTGGETLVIPGSHRGGPITVGKIDQDFPEQIVLSPKKGTLILIHGHLWHRVLPVSGPYRFSANYRCCPAHTPNDITDICVYRNMRYQFSTQTVIEERKL